MAAVQPKILHSGGTFMHVDTHTLGADSHSHSAQSCRDAQNTDGLFLRSFFLIVKNAMTTTVAGFS